MALTTAPEPGTYRFVLRTHRAYDPQLVRTAYTYVESVESRDITHPDGIRHPTIFVANELARDRLEKDGWLDVSAMWFEHLAAQSAPAEPEAPRRVKIKA